MYLDMFKSEIILLCDSFCCLCSTLALPPTTPTKQSTITALASIPDPERTQTIEEWANTVSTMVHSQSELDPCFVERSIVSIRVAKNNSTKKDDDRTEWLDMNELRDLYRWMSMDVSHVLVGVPTDVTTEQDRVYLSKPTYIGQPVDVSDSYGIVRIALGVESLLSYFDDKDRTLDEDRATVHKLAAISRHFDTLKKSGL
jgi:hypothetical protein